MIHRTGSAKLVALSVALVLHGALAVALVSRETTEIEGADGGTEVRLGNAFADMAAGTLTSASVEKAEVSAPETSDRLDAERAEPTPPETAVTTVKASPADTVRSVDAEIAPSETTERLNAEGAMSTQPETGVAAIQHVAADTAQPVELEPVPFEAAPITEAPALVQTALPAPDAAQAIQPLPVSERVKAEASHSAAVARSLRPIRRSPEFETAHKPVQAARPKPQQKAEPARRAKPAPGNSERNARAGEATGQKEAVARQSGTGGRQQAAGNAAASNYPGQVMRKLSRAGKPRVDARGTAVVAFSIAANGGLSSVSLARSSGATALDQAALQLVRGAGPFPRPPAGAQRSFSIQIKGR